MKSIGKNFAVIFLTAIFAMTCAGTAFAQAGDVSLIPDVQNKSVSILGQLAGSGGVNYIANITGFSEDIVVFSDGNPPLDSHLFTTYQGGYAGRDINSGETIYFADTFAPGHYNMYIYYNEENTNKRIIRSFFIIDPNDPAVVSLLANLNLATTGKTQFVGYLRQAGALSKIGIYDAEIASSGDYSLEHAYDVRPAGGYDVAALQSAITDGDIIYYLKNYGVDSLTKNKMLLGSAYTNDYPSLNQAEKAELDNLLKIADYTAKPLADTFEDMLITAKIKCATNRTDMQNLVISSASKLGINIGASSVYGSVNDLYKSEVFNLMLLDKVNFKSMAEIAASFNLYAAQMLNPPQTPTVGGTGGGAPGGTQTSSGNILSPGAVSSQTGRFSDISGHFAQNDIIKLASLGIANGFEDGSYRPHADVTRAQFAKLICLSFGITGGYSDFKDVAQNEWYAPYINALSSIGIITGYDGYFYPDNNIKREDAALIINRIAERFGLNQNAGTAISFADEALISEYAKSAVIELSKLGIINGDGVNFNPLNFITRGEAAAIISRIYDIYTVKGA